MSVVRPATPDDVPVILRLIHELAVYEKEPDAVKNTEQALRAHLFGQNPRVFAHVALDEVATVVGVAVWFVSYSTWEGVHGVYLEDLYVRESARGGGHGTALLRELALLARSRGYARVEWAVLSWNTPSIGFYESIGARGMADWTTYRLAGAALEQFAGQE